MKLAEILSAIESHRTTRGSRPSRIDIHPVDADEIQADILASESGPPRYAPAEGFPGPRPQGPNYCMTISGVEFYIDKTAPVGTPRVTA